MEENTEDSLTTLRKASCASHGMKDGRMIPKRGKFETKIERDWVNTIIVVILVVNARGHGATRHLKGLYGSTVTLWYVIEQLKSTERTLEVKAANAWDGEWCASVFVASSICVVAQLEPYANGSAWPNMESSFACDKKLNEDKLHVARINQCLWKGTESSHRVELWDLTDLYRK